MCPDRVCTYLGPTQHVCDRNFLSKKAGSMSSQLFKILQWNDTNCWMFGMEWGSNRNGTGIGRLEVHITHNIVYHIVYICLYTLSANAVSTLSVL